MSTYQNKNGTSAVAILTGMRVIQVSDPDPWGNYTEREDYDDGKTYTPLHQKPKRSKFKRRSK